MAKVVAKVLGGAPRDVEGTTVADVRAAMGAHTHTAMVDGRAAQDSQVLEDNQYLSFSPAVKGGQ